MNNILIQTAFMSPSLRGAEHRLNDVTRKKMMHESIISRACIIGIILKRTGYQNGIDVSPIAICQFNEL